VNNKEDAFIEGRNEIFKAFNIPVTMASKQVAPTQDEIETVNEEVERFKNKLINAAIDSTTKGKIIYPEERTIWNRLIRWMFR
jgi:hypothetical protein